MNQASSMVATVACALSALSVGCGHPATREECLEILDKNAEFELRAQNITDEAEIARRVQDARAQKQDLLQDCIGNRITDDAMQCVRQATSAEAFDACLE